ncbi:MAG: response regulator, partial [Acidobacteriaceae bacterium]
QSIARRIVSVVDDDSYSRESIANLLGSAGFATECFSSAEELFDSGVLGRTGCLVLDVRMPGVGGLELQDKLPDPHRDIPVIFVTGQHDDDLRREVQLKRRVQWFYKPLDADKSLEAVAKAFLPG